MISGRPFQFACLAAFVAAVVATPELVANEYILRLIVLFLIYSIIALGLNVLVGLAGLVSLGQAGLYAIGAYAGAILATRLNLNLIPCLLAAVVMSGAFGVLLAYPTVRVRGVYLAVVTIAFGIIVENVAIEWESLTGAWVGISNVPAPSLAGVTLTGRTYFYAISLAVLATFMLNLNLMRSRYGRAMIAVSQSEIAASSLGVNVIGIRTLAFVVSACTAGAAGVFYVFLNKYVSPDIFNFGASVRFLLMVILGGAGTAVGPVVGAGVLTYLPEVLQQFGAWQNFVYGALLAIVMYVMPRGIVGTAADFMKKRLASPISERPTPEPPPLADVVAAPPADGETICLEARDLTVQFGGLIAVNGVNIGIERGKIHALIGPNGAGKSTFINAISGIYRSTAGRVSFAGEDTTELSADKLARKGLARTFQNTEMFQDMTVLENVLVALHSKYSSGFAATILRLPSFRREEEAFHARAANLLRYVGLAQYASEKAKSLAFGHQRRLEIARALALSPSLLLLDEPAAGLTSQEIDALIDLIRSLSRHGITILIIEHHVDLVMRLSDSISVLDYGELIAAGTAATVQKDPKVIEAYFGAAPVPALGKAE